MSDSERPKSGGDQTSADEINQDLPVQVNAGETINGATLPVALYMDDTDNEVKACDADDQDKLEFIGFGVSNSTDGNPITLQKDGVVGGFSGLDIGKKYYVQDDKTIGTSPGTYQVLVGIAISTTSLRIIKGINEFLGFVATDNLQASADTERSEAGTVYVKVKEILVKSIGNIRIDFDLKQNDGAPSYTAFARIYVNGVAVGTERSTDSTSYVTQATEDIAVEPGDLVQLYLKIQTAGGGKLAYVRNFRLYYNILPINAYTIEQN